MPIYEYECEKCGLVFEARQKFSDAPLTTCTSCAGSVKKLISKTGFSLKGSGWYQQGYSPSAPTACSAGGEGKGAGCAGCPKAVNE
jgi:putative FmdB family regulatory protein